MQRAGSSVLRITSLVSSMSGILLLSLSYLSAITGLCLRSPSLAQVPPLSLLGGYGLCSYLHVELLPLALVSVGVLHAIAAVELLTARFASAPRSYRLLVELFRLTTWLLAGHLLALTVVAYTL